MRSMITLCQSKKLCINSFVQQRELHMHYNHLTTLPPEIGDFAHLEKLFLSHNALMSLPPLCLSSAEEVS